MESMVAANRNRPAAKRTVAGVTVLVLYVAGFFFVAGRLDWLEGWVFIALLTCGQTVVYIYLKRRNPDVLIHRARVGADTKKWDKPWLAVFAILYMAILYTAALDAGRHGGAGMARGWWIVGAVLYLAFHLLVTWAMAVNPHFEKTVRIQHDRDHRVVETGPYRFVRHPGYTGSIGGYFLAPPFLLGSWWAMMPALIASAWLVFRTVLEDRTLRTELKGYAAYSERVRYRLVPWIW